MLVNSIVMGGSKVAARLPQILERFSRAMNVKTNRHAESNSYNFRVPGFKYDDFDRGGFVNLVKINRMMETNRTANLKQLDIENMEHMSFFMFGNNVQASKQLYRTAALEFPMKFHMQLGGIGKSSMDVVQLLIKEEADTVLAQRIHRIVHVDPKTRTTAPIPEEIRSQIEKKLTKTPEYLRLPKFESLTSVPERCFVHEVVVRYADLDFFFHSNQGSYLLYAFECATRAAAEGFYSRIREDICYYPAKTASGIHLGEAFAGHVLQVVTWEDVSNPMCIYFVMRHKDKDVYHAKVEFYDEHDFNGGDA